MPTIFHSGSKKHKPRVPLLLAVRVYIYIYFTNVLSSTVRASRFPPTAEEAAVHQYAGRTGRAW